MCVAHARSRVLEDTRATRISSVALRLLIASRIPQGFERAERGLLQWKFRTLIYRGVRAALPLIAGYERGQVAQMVERSPEKAGVGGSIPSLATTSTTRCIPVSRTAPSTL